MRLEDPGDLPAAARHLQRHPVRRHQALRQSGDPVRRARDPTSRAHHPVLTNRDLTELPVHIQTDRATNPSRQSQLSPPLDCDAGEPAGQRHRPIRARSSIQASRRGGRTKSTGSKLIDQLRPTRLRSPNEAPVPDEPNVRPRPGRNLQAGSFMPRDGAARCLPLAPGTSSVVDRPRRRAGLQGPASSEKMLT